METGKNTISRGLISGSTTNFIKESCGKSDKFLNYFDNVIEKAQNERNHFFQVDESGEPIILDFDLSHYQNKPLSSSGTYAQSYTKLKGFVTSIKGEYFEAKLEEEKLNGTFEIGEFDISDVDEDDKDLFVIGGVFYWTFGYFKIKGQVKKMSEIRFQRIAILDNDEVNNILDDAENLNDSIIWD